MIRGILCALALGVGIGYFNLVPPGLTGYLGITSKVLLMALLFLVGVDVGVNREVMTELRTMGVKILAIPLMITSGSLLGGFFLSFFVDLSVPESLAVASGMGYYTLSSIILTQTVGSSLGTVAFLSNIFREILTFVISPVIAKMSILSPVASGGATSMDTTLPVIIQCTSRTVGVIAVISGVIITLLVPFLVTFFAQFI
jgi:uncharacterized membrane protein YbjE (DUF340 family)